MARGRSPACRPAEKRRSCTLISPWGMPVYVDLDMATDDPYVAASKQFRVCFGEMRLDSSLVAGTRYDANVTGFRLERQCALRVLVKPGQPKRLDEGGHSWLPGPVPGRTQIKAGVIQLMRLDATAKPGSRLEYLKILIGPVQVISQRQPGQATADDGKAGFHTMEGAFA